MKRRLLQLSIWTLIAGFYANAGAQITIDQADFPVATTSHRSQEFHVANDSAYTNPTDGTNQIWDYQGFVSNGLSSFPYALTSDPYFSVSHHYEAGSVALSVFRVLSDAHFGLDGLGYYEYGKQQYDTTFSIAAVTGGANDELHFLDAKEYYDGAINQVFFPLTMGDAWVDTMSRTTPFEITVAGFGLNNTPGFHKRIAYSTKEITGYGKLVMTHPNGFPSDSMDVLLMKTTEVQVDSFFVGGAPAPTPLLQGLGVTQGQIATEYKSHFYRIGYGDHIIELKSVSAAGGSGLVGIFYNEDAILANSVGLLEPANQNLSLYPNPVQSGGKITIDLGDAAPAISTVRIISLDGKEVYLNNGLIAGQRITQLSLPEGLPPGCYVVQVYSIEDQALHATQLLVID